MHLFEAQQFYSGVCRHVHPNTVTKNSRKAMRCLINKLLYNELDTRVKNSVRPLVC